MWEKRKDPKRYQEICRSRRSLNRLNNLENLQELEKLTIDWARFKVHCHTTFIDILRILHLTEDF